jgi:ATP-dependent exoDNAse (exonuclease V) beta subunit
MTATIPDARQRLDALDPARSFIVQAPAGAGKTGLLTQRYLRLLSTVDEPEEIVAITFTRKAASEMRNRILEALRSADAGTTARDEYGRTTLALAAQALERSQARGWSLTRNPGRLQVRTIDSLCHSLARRLPLLSRSGGPSLAVDDAQQLYRLAARRTLALVDDETFGEPVSALLAHLDNNPGRAEELLAVMLARRDQWLRHLGGERRLQLSRAALEESLRRLVDETLDRLDEALPPALVPLLWESAQFARDHLPDGGQENALGRWDGIPPTAKDGGDRLDRWTAMNMLLLTRDGSARSARGLNRNIGFPAGTQGALGQAKKQMAALLDVVRAHPVFVERLARVVTLPAPRYSDAQWGLLERLPALLSLAYAQLRLIFAERGITDHAEAGAAAGRALGDDEAPTDLALALDYRLKHLLVDEFQDTSRSQFDLLARLSSGWQPGDGRSFFAVGDPMQSIYRFRQAEVALFIEARDRGLGQLPLDSLVLQTNFRSAAQIVDWVNTSFATLFPDQDDCDRGAIRYAPARAVHGEAAAGGVTIHPLFNADGDTEASLAADLVEQARQAGQRTIAVLARSRTHLHGVAAELAKRGHRFQAVDVQRLGEHLAVRELRALLRALVLPGDRAAWLAVLRAPWCGLDLADLTVLAGDDPHAPVMELLADDERLARLSADGQPRARRVREILGAAISHRRRRSLRQAVEAAWLALGGAACLQSAADLAATEAFLELVGEYETAAELPLLQRVDEALSNLFAPPDPGAPDTIQLMTVHKAKGLEFDTVILPGLGRAPRGNERELVQWLEWEGSDGTPHFVLAPIAESTDTRDPLEQLLRRTEQEKQDLETVRLLYVAATRAKECLHLIGTVRRADDPDAIAPRRNTLLHPLWPVVGARFQESLPLAGPPGAGATAQEEPLAPPPPLIRARSLWAPPPVPSPLPGRCKVAEETAAPEYLWAGSSARHIGTVIHRYLERIAQDGLHQWNAKRVMDARATIGRALEALAVCGDALDQAIGQVVHGLTNTLEDERGRWILSGHDDARAEYALTAHLDGQPMNLVIDRTFVADGVRWIIDYKTGSHQGGRAEEFLDREQERYALQLERYAQVLSRLDPGLPVRAALYFPLLKGWREWSPVQDATPG